jgi:hypothetical protein
MPRPLLTGQSTRGIPVYDNGITTMFRSSFKTCGRVPFSSSSVMDSITQDHHEDSYGSSSSSSLPNFLTFEALLGALAAVLLWHKLSAITAAATEALSSMAMVSQVRYSH